MKTVSEGLKDGVPQNPSEAGALRNPNFENLGMRYIKSAQKTRGAKFQLSSSSSYDLLAW
jgi:hypothetical protein